MGTPQISTVDRATGGTEKEQIVCKNYFEHDSM